MSDEDKSVNSGSAKSAPAPASGSAASNRAPANVSVLKIPAKAESKGGAAVSSGEKKKKKAQPAPQKVKKIAPRKPEAIESKGTEPIETKAKTQANTGNSIKEKTMAQKNSSNNNTNINVPFDGLAKEAAEMSREYSEACVKSGTILMKGMEDFVGVVMSLAQNSAEKQAKFLKEAMSSKTINEFAEVQNKIAQANFDDFMASATKLTEIGTKLLTDSAEPVNAQIGKAIKRASESAAA